jgi:hypothetical protein
MSSPVNEIALHLLTAEYIGQLVRGLWVTHTSSLLCGFLLYRLGVGRWVGGVGGEEEVVWSCVCI